MKKNWKIKELEIKSADLPEYPALVLRLLALRGITDPDAVRDFLSPDYQKLLDPFLFQEMQKAVDRINLGIERKEKITIYADYDADAITACAVLYLALKKLGVTPDYYIPDRFSEGYGLNLEAIKQIVEKGAKVIITVDCGTNAVEEANLCKELGVDLIITDHHELTGEVPQALALINHKAPGEKYPFQILTGVGVAFKLVQALFLGIKNNELRIKVPEGYEKWFLDLVAIGTVADCQSLTGENRVLVSFGLKVLEKTKWPGLKALLDNAGLKNNKYDTFTLGFILAPRINAAGRIKHGDVAFQVLISEDVKEAEGLAKELTELNQHRQMLTEQILSEAKGQIELISDKKILMAFGEDWPRGVVGLVAGKLAEEYNRPVLAASITPEGLAIGSARSVPDFDIVAALNFSKDLLQKYGGHKQAAGFTLHKDNLKDFYNRLLAYAESLNLAIFDPVLKIDAKIESVDLSWETYSFIEQLSPFGIDNPKPRFLGEGLEVLECRPVGASSQHCKLKVKFKDKVFEAIAFGQGFLNKNLTPGKKIDAVFELTSNEWNGNKELQLKIIDTQIHDR